MANRWKSYREKWIGGCGSALCDNARKICLARGKIPCDILFIGEAPSISADVIGQPFIGEIGCLMDNILDEAGANNLRHAFTNVVCCVPRNPEDRSKVIPPSDDAINSCSKRLLQFIQIARPKLIVAVGTIARNTIDNLELDPPVEPMPHPATILYARPYGGHEFRVAARALKRAISRHFPDANSDA